MAFFGKRSMYVPMSTLLVLIHQPLKMAFEKFHKCVSMIAKKSFEHDETPCIKSIVAFMFLKAQILNEFVHFGSITEKLMNFLFAGT